MSRRPVIGITAAIHPAAWTVWRDVEANVSQRTYSLVAANAGALPLILPPDAASAEDPEQLLGLLDALVLAGGADVDPALYGARPEPETQAHNPDRDAFELALALAALDRDLPLLGICRGMELLNVACGGTLEQHLAEADRHLHTPGRFSDHDVRLEPGSLAAAAIGRDRVSVRSHHHQGVGRLGEGIVASGWSEPDGVVEAIEVPGRTFALGVLWHEEEDRRSPVIAALVSAARERLAALR
ncbi:MAG TPA: gamma-glutamyl-gamma-aminobutyrate hydrolase family protein [Solirubrobacterales bacterium]|nr:gamma-glutamyl-gamma-aminobutyrate hydrolase family protein [Solirubrobacterales bacterium]